MTTNLNFQLSNTKVIKPVRPVGIVATGSYLPPTIIHNDDFTRLELSENDKKFMDEVSGIKRRHFANGESYTEMAIKAGIDAIKNSHLTPEEIDLVLVTHVSRDMNQFTPPNCIAVQTGIGAVNATSINIDAGFSGWIYTLTTGASFICSGFYKNVLVVSGETLLESTTNDIPKALMVGDGAGAFILSETERGHGLLGYHLMSTNIKGIAAEVKITGGFPAPSDKNYTIKPYFTIHPDSLKNDSPYVENLIPFSIHKILNELNFVPEEINKYIFAQKFLGMNKRWAHNVGIDYSLVHDTLEETACIETSSIPIITNDAVKKGKIKKGDLVMFADLGSRWNTGAALFRWNI